VTVSPQRLLGLVAAVVALAAAGSVLTGGTVVPPTNAGRVGVPVDANALAPSACSSLDLTSVVTGTTGTAANELILATAGADTIDGHGGTDCIVGGGGDDQIDGRGGSICVGGPGTDQFVGCATAQQ
jgi:Ca2+-binding RTX toxin-like protein